MITNYIYNIYWLGWSLSLGKGGGTDYLYDTIVFIYNGRVDGLKCRCAPLLRVAAPSFRGPNRLALIWERSYSITKGM